MINPIPFIKAFWSWITGKQKLLPPILIQLRWKTCQGCPLVRKSWFRTYCGVCKCTLSEKRHPFHKLAYPDEECPRGYWNKVKHESE